MFQGLEGRPGSKVSQKNTLHSFAAEEPSVAQHDDENLSDRILYFVTKRADIWL